MVSRGGKHETDNLCDNWIGLALGVLRWCIYWGQVGTEWRGLDVARFCRLSNRMAHSGLVVNQTIKSTLQEPNINALDVSNPNGLFYALS